MSACSHKQTQAAPQQQPHFGTLRCRWWEPSTASNSHVLLSSAQQIQILRLLVERIDVAPDGIDVRLCTGGIDSIVSELISEGGDEPAASAEALTEEAAA